MTRANLDAWCLDCFKNNFTVPTSSVTILSSDVGGLDADEVDPRKAITARAVLRDVADVVATENRGRVLNNSEDDVRLEFAKAQHAVAAARALHAKFHESATKLKLPTPDLCSGLHQGEVTRSRDGDVFGDAPREASLVRGIASTGQIVVSGAVVDELGPSDDLEDIGERIVAQRDAILSCWALRG